MGFTCWFLYLSNLPLAVMAVFVGRIVAQAFENLIKYDQQEYAQKLADEIIRARNDDEIMGCCVSAARRIALR